MAARAVVDTGGGFAYERGWEHRQGHRKERGMGNEGHQPPRRFAAESDFGPADDDEPERLRVQAWLGDGEEIDSVIRVWPAAV